PDYMKLGGPWINGQDPSEPGAKKTSISAPKGSDEAVVAEASNSRSGILSKLRRKLKGAAE
ncbi:MAG: hypothetical protein JHD20_01245, partial [Gemmataceae bacterium]|nr:hypothetical protein [Gemmataceae bacterium]